MDIHKPKDPELSGTTCHINGLPAEVLSTIWLLSLHPARSKLVAIERDIRTICKYWRNLAAETPILYSVLSSEDPQYHLQHAITKSDTLPLSITLRGAHSGQTTDQKTFIQLLMPHIHRWEHASLDLTGMGLNVDLLGEKSAPILETLNICHTSSPLNGFALSAPRLRQAYFTGFLWHDLGRLSPNLTRLKVDTLLVSMEELIRVLSTLPKLEVLQLAGTYPRGSDDPKSLEILSIKQVVDMPVRGHQHQRPFAHVSCPNWTTAMVCLDLRAERFKPSLRDHHQFLTAFHPGAEGASVKFSIRFPTMEMEARDRDPTGTERVFLLNVSHREPFSIVDWILSEYQPDPSVSVHLKIANIHGREKYLDQPLSQASKSRVNILHMHNITAGIHSLRSWVPSSASVSDGITYPLLKKIWVQNCDIGEGDILEMTKACSAEAVSQGCLQTSLECFKVDGKVSELERQALEAALGDKFVHK